MKKIKLGDIILISILLLIIVLGLIFLRPKSKGEYVTVSSSGEIIGKYPLYESIETDIKTEKGINRLAINEGYASITFADCKNNICVKSSAISKIGESIVCLPHSLIIEITKE